MRFLRNLSSVRRLRTNILVGTLLFIAIAFAGIGNLSHPAFRSVEVKFTDASHSGLSIVPASCPSNPGDGDAPYGCSGGSPLPPPPSCPFGFTAQGGVCVFSGCAAGQHAVGGICVCNSTNLPADSSGQCTSQVCPTGFQFDPGSGRCVAISQCLLPDVCSDATHILDQCTRTVTDCSLNGRAWVCQNATCVKLPPPIASISAVPNLISPGYKAKVSWTSTNTSDCTVSGNNGDGPWTGTTNTHDSTAIQSQTIFTLSCNGLDGSTISKTATVNIIPSEQER